MKWNWRVTGTSKLPVIDNLSGVQEELIRRYVNAMETEQSKDWCKCLWRIHPDDQDVSKGSCRECGATEKSAVHSEKRAQEIDPKYYHPFKGRRMTKVDNHPMCPVHTREGMIAYFFVWSSQQ